MPALAITLPQFRSAPDATLEALEDGRRLGYAGGFVFDHLWPLGQPQRPALECWTLLAGQPTPPIWVGGTSRRAHGLAGRAADAWNAWGLDPDELAAGLGEVRRAAEDAGRDPRTVDGTWGGQVLVADDQGQARDLLERWGAGRSPAEVARTVAGDGASVARRLAELGDAGASWCVLAFVGGSASRMRTLLAKASNLSIRPNGVRRYDR